MKNILVINPWAGNIGPNTFLRGFVRQIDPLKNKLTILYPYTDTLSDEFKLYGHNVYFNRCLKLNHVNNIYLKILKRVANEIYLSFYFYLLIY